ncbi:MarR family transcriptional regulator [Pediococcus inopinatus]|uniref:MarR family winged helix-turn-helix transcriptional regulator n=1 Tax=Pediococcus inopinatus TaxID=114090 RepID=UPI002B257C28|nr:MarR family transcriptional regulator [Pediococcus inopinatus]WPC17291.1 MarR family transcriptional regulator [Pediococcus inopinatus]
MSEESQELLSLFGNLFQERFFVAAAVKSSRDDETSQANQRGQLRVLRLLVAKEPLTNSQIVEELDIRPSSASVLVSKLADSGLVKKVDSPDDKRVTFISLTDKGRESLEKSRRFKNELSDSFFETLSDEEQQQFKSYMQKLLQNLNDKAPEWETKQNWAEVLGVPEGFNPKNWNHRPFQN